MFYFSWIVLNKDLSGLLSFSPGIPVGAGDMEVEPRGQRSEFVVLLPHLPLSGQKQFYYQLPVCPQSSTSRAELCGAYGTVALEHETNY